MGYRVTRAAYGTKSGRNPFVDAGPVRDHVRALMAEGLGIDSQARVSGVNRETIDYLLYGDSRHPPARRMLEETAVRILSVTAELDNFAPKGRLNSTISVRKLQAMIAMGWSIIYLSGRLGIARNNFHAMIMRDRISGMRARAIRDLYNELWMTRPKPKNRHQMFFLKKVLRYAESHGYVTGMAWDNIEDLTEPQPPLPKRTPGIAWDEVEFLRSYGMCDDQVAKAIGVTVFTLKDRDARTRKAKRELTNAVHS